MIKWKKVKGMSMSTPGQRKPRLLKLGEKRKKKIKSKLLKLRNVRKRKSRPISLFGDRLKKIERTKAKIVKKRINEEKRAEMRRKKELAKHVAKIRRQEGLF